MMRPGTMTSGAASGTTRRAISSAIGATGTWPGPQALDVARAQGRALYAVMQPTCNLYDRHDFEASLAPVIREKGPDAIGCFPLASGFPEKHLDGRGARNPAGIVPLGPEPPDALHAA